MGPGVWYPGNRTMVPTSRQECWLRGGPRSKRQRVETPQDMEGKAFARVVVTVRVMRGWLLVLLLESASRDAPVGVGLGSRLAFRLLRIGGRANRSVSIKRREDGGEEGSSQSETEVRADCSPVAQK
nr:hypothetical protein BaRGS_002340 [Batillaria attramentaria]